MAVEVAAHGGERPLGGRPVPPLPVSAASRSSTVVAIAPPDGVALSCTSRGRTTSGSPSSAVS